MSIIEIKNLCKTFDGTTLALNNINLSVEKGDIMGVIGLSGAGKSTLVRCINGLEKFDDGQILYNGKAVEFTREYRRKVTMIFQQFNLLQQRTVLKNVELAGELIDDKARAQKAIDLLTSLGLGDKLDSYPSRLSGGQQQRVAIARALMTDPEVILCDEATSALDPETTKSILDLLKDLNKKLGITIIVISHQMSVIEAICNKVAIIDHSEIVEQGEIQDVFLTPKTAIAKKLVYSGHITVNDNSTLIKVMFNHEVDIPVINDLIKDCGISLSILYAESKEIGGKTYGQTIFKLTNYDKDIAKVRDYFKTKGVLYEEVSSDGLC